ncbi:hypothetical protein OC845_004524 [Tilletia horrida]|nr:hypothetical protein OC845_004524 [Tilletia horrida]
MLASFATIASIATLALLPGSVQAVPVEARSGTISCGPAIASSNLVLTIGGSKKLASFAGAEAPDGNLPFLTASVDGVPSSGDPQFAFHTCNSTVMPTEETSGYFYTGRTQFFGQLRSGDKCVTRYIGGDTPAFVAKDCLTADNDGLTSQWFSAVTIEHIDAPLGYTIKLVGKTKAQVDAGVFGGYYPVTLVNNTGTRYTNFKQAEVVSVDLAGSNSTEPSSPLYLEKYQTQ